MKEFLIESKRRKAMLDKFAGELIDDIIFDTALTDDEVGYLMLKIQEEMTNYFESLKED
jgi:hypothetical protein